VLYRLLSGSGDDEESIKRRLASHRGCRYPAALEDAVPVTVTKHQSPICAHAGVPNIATALALTINGDPVDTAPGHIAGLIFTAAYDAPFTLTIREKAKHYAGSYRPGDLVELQRAHSQPSTAPRRWWM
jgi:hypothetical protein